MVVPVQIFSTRRMGHVVGQRPSKATLIPATRTPEGSSTLHGRPESLTGWSSFESPGITNAPGTRLFI